MEKDIQPLRDSNRTLKVEKDTLLAEKAALGKEIDQWVKRSNQLLEQRADREEMKQITLALNYNKDLLLIANL